MQRPLARLAPLALAALLAVPAQAQINALVPGAEEARIEVQRGRVVLLNGGRAEQTLRTGEGKATQGLTHLEVGMGSEVRIAWPGQASLHVWGPSSLQWSYEPAPKGGPATAQPTLRWSVYELAWCDLEVRQGTHALELPGDWTASTGPGAVYLRGLPAGPVELRLHAGQPVRLDWSGDPSQARPPVLVNPGSSVRLERPKEAPLDRSGSTGSWRGEGAWPYRRPVDDGAQRAQRAELARQTRRQAPWPAPAPLPEDPVQGQAEGRSPSMAKVAERPLPERVTVERDPLPLSARRSQALPPTRSQEGAQTRSVLPQTRSVRVAAPKAAEVQPPGAPAVPPKTSLPSPTVEPEPAPQVKGAPKPQPVQAPAPKAGPKAAPQPEATPLPTPTPKPAPEAQPERKPVVGKEGFKSAHWGGLSPSQLQPCGTFGVEQGPHVEVRMFDRGRVKVLVDPHAGSSARVFTDGGDHVLQPGAVAVFDDQGQLKLSFGKIETLAPPKGRASFQSLLR